MIVPENCLIEELLGTKSFYINNKTHNGRKTGIVVYINRNNTGKASFQIESLQYANVRTCRLKNL